MQPSWFKARKYKHFDVPVGGGFASKAGSPAFVQAHSWSPLISYVRRVKRYKPKDNKNKYKYRTIMYASHRDSCILSKYSNDLSVKLEEYYELNGLNDFVIAYRKLGKGNYDFSSDVHAFAKSHAPCVVYCFDVTGFFDNLDHGYLKARLREIFDFEELPLDWLKVFRHVTKYKYVEMAALKAHVTFGPRLKFKTRTPICTMSELVSAGIRPTGNPDKFGIPQGTPISSSFSNLYMMSLDAKMADICVSKGALYRRYSDDILIIIKENDVDIISYFKNCVNDIKLTLNDDKEERIEFSSDSSEFFQYLGFNMTFDEARIRTSSLSRQWRKARRALKHIRGVGEAAVASGKASKIYTRKLRKRFLPLPVRNFSSYARRSARALSSKDIVRQVRRLERMAEKAIRDLNP